MHGAVCCQHEYGAANAECQHVRAQPEGCCGQLCPMLCDEVTLKDPCYSTQANNKSASLSPEMTRLGVLLLAALLVAAPAISAAQGNPRCKRLSTFALTVGYQIPALIVLADHVNAKASETVGYTVHRSCVLSSSYQPCPSQFLALLMTFGHVSACRMLASSGCFCPALAAA
jgi:hypothetical protein